MYSAEIDLDGCYGQLYAASPEFAIQAVINDRFQRCPNSAQPANPLIWTASGEYWAPLYSDGVIVGQIFDGSGTPLNVGTFQYQWSIPGDPQLSDSSFSFVAACGLVVLFALGYIGGHQR